MRASTGLGSLGLAALLAGCAGFASGPRFADAPVPDPFSDKAVLYVFRDHAVPEEAVAFFDVNGEEAVGLRQRGFSWFYLGAGAHEFQYRWSLTTWITRVPMPRVRMTKTVEAGRTYVVELRADVEPKPFIIRSRAWLLSHDPDEGFERIRICCHFVPPTRRDFGDRT